MSATVSPADAVDTITWTSSDKSVAKVDENGKVTFVGGGTATITAKTVNGLTGTCEITSIPFDGTITLGETTVVITEDEVTKEQTLAFTPAETGYYRLSSHDIDNTSEDAEIDPRVTAFDGEYGELAYSDDVGYGVDFSLEMFMEAGKTYYYNLTLYRPEATGSYKITLAQLTAAVSVRIDSGDIVMKQGESREVTVTYAPEGCSTEEFTVTSSDDSVVDVSDYEIYAMGAGEATVTVTSANGLTDSITVKVNGAMALELDTTCTVEGTAQEEGGLARYAFTPTVSGRYTIASCGVVGEDATVSVALSELGNQLRNNDTDSDSFSLTYELEADVEYYYDVEVVSEAAESAVRFMLTKEDDGNIPTATVNADLAVKIANPGDGVYYAFKPTATGVYKIFSQYDAESNLDPKLIVYDAGWEYLEDGDDTDGGNDCNFLLEYEFTAGETYYLKAITYNSYYTGEYTMRIEPLFDMTTAGDLTGDGIVNMMDALLLYSGVSSGTLTAEQEAVADYNGDGTIDMMDALLVYAAVSAGEQPLSPLQTQHR